MHFNIIYLRTILNPIIHLHLLPIYHHSWHPMYRCFETDILQPVGICTSYRISILVEEILPSLRKLNWLEGDTRVIFDISEIFCSFKVVVYMRSTYLQRFCYLY